MLASSLIGILCGLLLGSRFKVFALVALQVLAVVVAAMAAAAMDLPAGRTAALVLCWSAALQLGYVVAILAGFRGNRTFGVSPSEA